MELFILDGIDYTNHITVPSYNVQSEPIYDEWEDATYTKHKDLKRWQVKGSFTIYFDDTNEFNAFLASLINLRGTDNYIPAVFYDNRTMSQKDSKFEISISLANDRPYYGVKKHSGYNVTIEEQ